LKEQEKVILERFIQNLKESSKKADQGYDAFLGMSRSSEYYRGLRDAYNFTIEELTEYLEKYCIMD